MKISDIRNEILRLKKEKHTCIAAHTYQSQEIKELADFTGDSFALSRKAASTDADTVILCGVRFMAESVKLLSPSKTVILANPSAGCPMAEQFTPKDILRFRAEHPHAAVVCYINTTNAIKSVCDVVVTSSSAVKIVRALGNKEILFVPDNNLGSYLADCLPDITVHLIGGCCPIHSRITAETVAEAKRRHPGAPFLVHPECRPEVVAQADYVGATSGILDFARNSTCSEFIIGTELSVVEQLSFEFPEKHFYPLSSSLICPDMRLTTLPDLLGCLRGTHGEKIVLDSATDAGARRAMDRMLELG